MFSKVKMQGLVNAMVVCAGVEKEPAKVDDARQSGFENMSLVGAIRALLIEANDPKAMTYSRQELAGMVIDAAYSRVSPQGGIGIGTNDLTSLLSSVAGASMAKGYREASTTFQFVTSRVYVNDFRPTPLYRVSEACDILEIPEGQPPLLGTLADSAQTVALKHFGRAILISEEAILCDRLDLVTSVPNRLGRAMSRAINEAFWKMLLTGNGPIMGETGRALFNVTDGNLLPAAALSEASLGAAYSAMLSRTLQNPGGQAAFGGGVEVRYVVVGAQDAIAAMRLTGADYRSEGGMIVNALVEPLLETLTGGRPVVVAADPAAIDAGAVVYLKGRPEPTLTTRIGGPGQAKGIFLDISHYWNVTVGDYRGFVKNPGA